MAKGRRKTLNLNGKGRNRNGILDVLNLRRDANEARNNATDQYEADVAEFKNNQATEAEQGIASLPEFTANTFAAPEAATNPYTEAFRSVRREADIETPEDLGIYEGTPIESPMPITSVGQTGTPGRNISGPEYWELRNQAEAAAAAGVGGPEPDLDSGTDGSQRFTTGSGPFSPADQPPLGPPITAPPGDTFMPLPIVSPIDDDRPRNIYTGRPLKNPYVPYEEPSDSMQDWTQPMDPSEFGSAPGMGYPVLPGPTPEPIFANRGGNLSIGQDNLLNKGLSRLPLNQQNDTLTQVFQSGFRPRR